MKWEMIIINIREFKENDSIQGTYLINTLTRGKASNGNDYLNLKLQDATGEIDCKYWNVKPEEMSIILNGSFVLIKASVIKYRDNLQLKIDKISIVESSQVDLNNFVKSAPISKEQLTFELMNYVADIKDVIISSIVEKMVLDNMSDLKCYPAAAKNHHAYNSGLLYHIVSMLKLAKSLAILYPSLDSDYLYAGVILHDLGKIEELSGVVATEYTIKGRLLGHISILSSKLYKAAQQLNFEDTTQLMLLQHLVLSHHGKLEYGSPVLPMTREAEILTFIDNIDARMDTLDRVLENTDENSFSAKVFALENRAFYNQPKK